MSQVSIRSQRVFIWLMWLTIIMLLLSACAPATATATAAEATPAVFNPIPVLAYYYIWFDPQSWDRAKSDYPLLGRYSSSDINVMRQHVKWAKDAGIDGFIVSWKSTDKLNQRLEQLIQVANEENFKLAIIYQGLDFNRNPISVQQVDADLSYFIGKYAKDPAFSIYDKPLVIWSGTWKFSREDIQSVVSGKRDQLLILASERNLDGYSRLADLVDGNAYYWSSVNPYTFPGYPEKLADMGNAVHANNGIWIAPVAPGFDARMIGGQTVVDRKDGQTLEIQFSAAMESSPDLIGLISWNEFSENSYVEPSVNYGRRYLDVLTNIHNVPVPVVSNFDSSDPGDTFNRLGVAPIIALGSVGLLIIVSLLVLLRRIVR